MCSETESRPQKPWNQLMMWHWVIIRKFHPIKQMKLQFLEILGILIRIRVYRSVSSPQQTAVRKPKIGSGQEPASDNSPVTETEWIVCQYQGRKLYSTNKWGEVCNISSRAQILWTHTLVPMTSRIWTDFVGASRYRTSLSKLLVIYSIKLVYTRCTPDVHQMYTRCH